MCIFGGLDFLLKIISGVNCPHLPSNIRNFFPMSKKMFKKLSSHMYILDKKESGNETWLKYPPPILLLYVQEVVTYFI